MRDEAAERRVDFQTTHWSVVLSAGDASDPRARASLSFLCENYWYPLYAFVRRKGHSAEESEDLTQAFFARFLQKNYLASVTPEKGRFRSYLLCALAHFLANEWDRQRAKKRGGDRLIHSLTVETAEGQYQLEPFHSLTPDRLFDRRWALTIVQQALDDLKQECEASGRAEIYEALSDSLVAGRAEYGGYKKLAAELGMSESAIKVTVHRLRSRYGEILRRRIAQTVSAPEEVDDEVRFLFRALSA